MVVIPSKMGLLNKRALVSRLQLMGAASRAGLAKSLGLSQPTAGKIVDEMLRLGVLEEIDNGGEAAREARRVAGGPGTFGRPARMIQLDRLKERFIAIQLGVVQTSLAALPVGVTGEDGWKIHFVTPGTAKEWLGQITKAAGRLPAKDLWGVLISVPGIVDEKRGEVVFSPNLHWTEGGRLTDLLARVWEAPVALVQEERALALGHKAVDPGQEDFLLVDFGDGVGGAVIVAGKLSMHPLPMSGELGHTPILGNKRPCGCGALGCLETLVSTSGLLQSFAAATSPAQATLPNLISFISEQGLSPWLTEALEAAASVIAGALNVCGLRRVVVTGSLTELPPIVFRYLSAAIDRGAVWARFGKVEVVSAPRRRTAGLVAAGIDRLVLPMPDAERNFETMLNAHHRHGAD
jgi:predicted NBD/HSP70 family sugar kinase